MLSKRRNPMEHSHRLGLLWLGLLAAIAAAGPIDQYDVVWTAPSRDASGSMPLGNGDISLNAWVEPSGDLCFYIGKTDAWGDNARLLKVGKVRLSLRPDPFDGSASFRQTLHLETGQMIVEWTPRDQTQSATVLQVWVDAHDPVIHVIAESPTAIRLDSRIELWRTTRQELTSQEVSDVMMNCPAPLRERLGPTIVEPDTVLTELSPGRIGWVHHNSKSIGPELTMRIQGLDDYPLADPLLGRTFGAVITADRARRLDDLTLTTEPGRSQHVRVFVLTDHPSTPRQWRAKVDQLIERVESTDPEARQRRHEQWWRDFWDRSWVHIRSNRPEPGPPLVGRNDHPLRIGVDQDGANRFIGQIGRVSILRCALSPGHVADLAKGDRRPLTRPDAVGTWTDVPVGKVLKTVSHEDLAGPLTIEAWVRPERMPASGGRIVDKTTPGQDNGLLLDAYPGNGLRWITPIGHIQSKDGLSPDRWHHVAVTSDPALGTQTLYLDGEAIGTQTVDMADPAFIVSRGYQLQRYINACAGRGRYPIKFNGSIFTVPFPGAPGDADYRRWGPGYWWQNTRLPYIGMCASGDFDLMEPLFRMYADEVLPLCVHRTKKYCGHDGAFIPECIYFWGAIFSETYGWTPFEQRRDKLQESGWHKWEWVSGPELVFMMLDYYDYTRDESFLKDKVVPTAHEILTFFDRHYPVGSDGKLIMHPSQALETWWDCTNPMPEVAGLWAVTQRLLDLPERLTTAKQRAFWEALREKLPPLPTRKVDGVEMLAPAEKYDQKRNIENPELYAVFPFRRVAFEKDNRDLGIEALNHRWDRGHSGWRQDDVFMAYLGLADQARQYVVARARSKDEDSRFPAFWGPNYDWVPDQDHGGVLVKAVQAMLLQSGGDRLFLFPAWPSGWDVDFKLHAPGRTTVQASLKDGKVVHLEVNPPNRKKDVVTPK